MKRVLFSAIIFSIILTAANLSFAEEQALQEPIVQETPFAQEVQWIWGDVVSLDLPGKKMLVKYLDYETDTEKEISIDIDDKTTYENVKSIDEVKPLDTVSIDYIVNTDGRNTAKNISVEKPEETQVLPQEEIKEEPAEVSP